MAMAFLWSCMQLDGTEDKYMNGCAHTHISDKDGIKLLTLFKGSSVECDKH